MGDIKIGDGNFQGADIGGDGVRIDSTHAEGGSTVEQTAGETPATARKRWGVFAIIIVAALAATVAIAGGKLRAVFWGTEIEAGN